MRQVPQDLTAEQSLLGAMLVDPNCIPEVIEQVRADDFYAEENKRIFETIYSMFNGAQRIDPVTVLDMLTRMGYYDEAGGRAYLFQLMEVTPGARNVNEYVRIVRDKSLLRQLADAGSEIQQNALEAHGEASGIAELAEQRIYSIRQGREIKGLSRLSEVIADLYTELDERARSDSEIPGMSTGFHALDTALTGLNKSDLILIAARPSMGKTAFVLSMARNIAVDHERPVAFFSLEMSSVQLMMRLIVAETGLAGNDVKSGRLTPEQWRHLESATKPLGAAPLYIDDTPALSVFEFRSKARRLKIHNDIQLIVIDYLQLMTGTQDSKGNREQEVAFISRTLKAIAKELNVPIIALSQLNRSTELRGGSKRPQLSDLRESGAIEQDADIVAFIHRPEYYGINQDENGMPTAGLAEIIIAKHRNGAVTDVNLRFLKDQARFADMDDSLMPAATPAGGGQQYDDFASGSNFDAGGSALGAGLTDEFGVGPVSTAPVNLNEEAPF